MELACATEGASIYYTTDGKEPTASSTAYTAAIPVLIVSGNKALSTQNTNNRAATSVIVADGTINTPSGEVQKLVLVKAGDYFYFNTGSGYLYAASSTSNYLRTEETPDDKSHYFRVRHEL